MDERKKQVLNAIIKDYIANAEPVGSRQVAKKYDLGVSSATIRNEMSDLTEDGYIEQPHTSAGRIPSGKGYRFYVDNLMERQRLTPAQMRKIRDAVRSERNEVNDFMRSCLAMISHMTSYTAIATVPEYGSGTVENIQLIPLNDYQVLVLILTSTGLVRHKTVQLQLPISAQQLAVIEDAVARQLRGVPIRRVSYDLLEDLLNDYQADERLAEQALSMLEKISAMSVKQPESRVFKSGELNMLSQPEFQDVEKLKEILGVLEEDELVRELLAAAADHPGEVTVNIGSEIPVPGIRDCSVVVADFYVGGEQAGTIGVLGPTRMSYGKTVSLIDFVANELSRALAEKDGKTGNYK